jgi:hypothetical protein
MAALTAVAERTIAAPVAELFSYVADFHGHHSRILPPAFQEFTVEAGGGGVGTITSSQFTLGRTTETVRTRVTRVEPERLIEEEVLDRRMTTTFRFLPGGDLTTVRIETTWTPRGGLNGLMERLFAPRLLSKVYADELDRLDAYAAGQA